MADRTSRISGFYRLPLEQRRELLGFTRENLAVLDSGGLDLATADRMIENVVGRYALPFALALNFRVNGRDRFVPMVVEEPSVVAAASNAARLRRCPTRKAVTRITIRAALAAVYSSQAGGPEWASRMRTPDQSGPRWGFHDSTVSRIIRPTSSSEGIRDPPCVGLSST